MTDVLSLSPRFSEAMSFALQRHWHQPRKGTEIPYMAHLLQVCGIVLEAGGDEDQAIAGLLHDAIEDAPPGQADWVRTQIGGRFGERVLRIVEACTDADVQPKAPWRERKESYLRHLPSAGEDALLVRPTPSPWARQHIQGGRLRRAMIRQAAELKRNASFRSRRNSSLPECLGTPSS